MEPELLATLERLAAAQIQLLPAQDLAGFFLFERDGFVALVERKGAAFGGVGSAGLLTGSGFAALVWRGEKPYFVGKGFEQEATAPQVETLRAFSQDLAQALHPR